MSQRKTYGNILMLSGLLLGLFLLTGAYLWMQDKANMLLGVFVFILYGMGQWLTILYWQRIQADWESTGETLARLQQAVTDIPSALDSNLKAIGTRLAEGQQKALSQLQGQVNEGARQVLEQGVAQIGASLDKNLRGPVGELQAALGAWQQGSREQLESLQASLKEAAAAQREGVAESRAATQALAAEMKALALSVAKAGDESRAAWSAEAGRILQGWETRVQGLEQRMVAALGKEAGRLGETLSGSAAAFEDGLRRIREASGQLIAEVGGRAEAGHAQLVERITEAQGKALSESGRNLEAQSRLGLELAEKVAALAARMEEGSKDFHELASLSRINQAEMQGGVGMLNAGLASILDRLDRQAASGDGQQAFMAEMGKALAAFQERAGEALMENALKTQEILMEVLNQAGKSAREPAEPSAASLG